LHNFWESPSSFPPFRHCNAFTKGHQTFCSALNANVWALPCALNYLYSLCTLHICTSRSCLSINKVEYNKKKSRKNASFPGLSNASWLLNISLVKFSSRGCYEQLEEVSLHHTPTKCRKKNTKKTIENKVKRSESWPNIQTPLSGWVKWYNLWFVSGCFCRCYSTGCASLWFITKQEQPKNFSTTSPETICGTRTRGVYKSLILLTFLWTVVFLVAGKGKCSEELGHFFWVVSLEIYMWNLWWSWSILRVKMESVFWEYIFVLIEFNLN